MGGEDVSEVTVALVGKESREESVARRENVSASTDKVNWSGTQKFDELKTGEENINETPKASERKISNFNQPTLKQQ